MLVKIKSEREKSFDLRNPPFSTKIVYQEFHAELNTVYGRRQGIATKKVSSLSTVFLNVIN